MIRKPVNSSRIRSVGWDNNVLEIEFKDGAIYQYLNVKESEYISFINSSSLGRALNLLDKSHPYRRV